MTAQRTAFDAEHDILQGRSLEAAKDEAARLTAKAQAITDHLARVHYPDSSVVRQNLENERNGLEWESHGIQARIAEYLGKIQRVRQIATDVRIERVAR